jgi:hypothetical protein
VPVAGGTAVALSVVNQHFEFLDDLIGQAGGAERQTVFGVADKLKEPVYLCIPGRARQAERLQHLPVIFEAL